MLHIQHIFKIINSYMFKTIKNVTGVIILIWLSYYLYNNWQLFKTTQGVSWQHLIILSVSVLATWIVNSLQVYLLLRAQGVQIGKFENLIVQTMAILANYFPMRIGTILRFKYFKVIHNTEYALFGGVMSVRALFLVLVTGLFGVMALTFWFNVSDYKGYIVFALFLSMLLTPLIIYISKPKINLKNKTMVKFIGLFIRAFSTVRKDHSLALVVIFLLLIQFILLSTRLYVSFDAMGVEIPIAAFLVLAPMATLLSFVSISPGNLGLREWVIGVFSAIIGYDFNIAMFAGLIDRVVLMACTFVFGGMSFIYVWKKINRI